MSGIAGIVRFDGEPPEPHLIGRMTDAMQHRGPDGIRHWQDGAAALGHCMLCTTPESLEEIQPLANEDASLVLVMDGRLDNWLELRQTLLEQGVLLRTRADAELVLRAYELWGSACLARLDGDFALAIYNAAECSVFCARDRIGNRNFYYHATGSMLVFATDMRALLALSCISRAVNDAALDELLAASWQSVDGTLWKDILRLPPAHGLQAGNAHLTRWRYWTPVSGEIPYRDDGEYFEQYRALVEDSVRRMSRSHKPLAIEVSGGLDSSAVFAVAGKLARDGTLRAPGLQGYTMDCRFDPKADELDYARTLAGFWNTSFHEVQPLLPDQAWFFARARAWQDFPGYPNMAMTEPLLALAAEHGSRVVLNGAGADEWLTGSRWYYAEALAGGDWRGLRQSFAADRLAYGAGGALYGLLRFGVFGVLPAAVQELLRRLYHLARPPEVSPLDRRQWLAPRCRTALQARGGLHGHTAVPRHGRAELLRYLADPYVDWLFGAAERICAGYALETRSPLNTRQMAEFMLATPERMRLRGNSHKFIHVQALQHLLPPAIAQRRSKAEFSAVFTRQLAGMRELLTSTLPQQHPDWVVAEGMAELYRICCEGRTGGWPQYYLWNVFACHAFDRARYA